MKIVTGNYYNKIFEPKLVDEIEKYGTLKTFKQGDIFLDIGTSITFLPLVISGAVKIVRTDEAGNEIFLYFLEYGDTCAMSLSCTLSGKKSEIRAIAEIDTEVILLPVDKFEEWMSYKSWRNFIFENYDGIFAQLLNAIDTLAFLNMHDRLFKYLKDKSIVSNNKTLNLSHKEIAFDLNTSRVVISRLLKQLENEEKVQLNRNKLTVLSFE